MGLVDGVVAIPALAAIAGIIDDLSLVFLAVGTLLQAAVDLFVAIFRTH